MSAKPPQKFNRRHQTLLMAVLLWPDKTQREISKMVGMTEAWVSTVLNSDMFREQLARVEGEFSGALLCSMREKAQAVMSMGMDRLMERMALGADKTEVIAGVVDKMNSIAQPSAAPVPANHLHVNISANDLAAAREAMRTVRAAAEPLIQHEAPRRHTPVLSYGLPEVVGG